MSLPAMNDEYHALKDIGYIFQLYCIYATRCGIIPEFISHEYAQRKYAQRKYAQNKGVI